MPPSSVEEIARQHEEAMKLVNNQPTSNNDCNNNDCNNDDDNVSIMQCSPPKLLGEIPLQDKIQPTWPTVQSTSSSSSLSSSQQQQQQQQQGKEEEEKKESMNDNIADQENDEQIQRLEQQQQQQQVLKRLINPYCWSTRGFVDVTKLQNMIIEGYNNNYKSYNKESNKKSTTTTNNNNKKKKNENENDHTKNNENTPKLPPLSTTNYWDPRNAAKYNVTLTRPSHDGWGIGKIVLIFSDDFLTKVYQLPWWNDFQHALQPIINILEETQPPTSKIVIVRALLASLPPGTTIPIHNDSGEWVKTTHRIHVPVIVNDPTKILFRCGPGPHLLQRIDCSPGHVFEINNQAKHTVSNCETDEKYHRVHLILDYVVITDETPDNERKRIESPIILVPGEKLVQTRRSIDRLKDMAERQTPSYIILGAQKAGTTSLYEYINQHPWVVKARRRETHCLDWRWNEQLKTKKGQLKYCQKFFYTEQMKLHPSCLTGDSTPSYLIDSRRVIPRIQCIFSWKMKFFVMMRDPVRRAASHYAMVTSTEGTPAQLQTRGKEWREKSLWEVVQSELSKMDDCGLIPYWDIETGIIDQACFDDFTGSEREDDAWNTYVERHVPLNSGSYGLLTRGMYAVQLRPWFRAFSRDQFLCLRLESMESNGVKETMEQVWAHLDLPNHPVHDESPKNTRDYQSMDSHLQSYLQQFFDPHNRILGSVVASNCDDWVDPWPYGKN